jgi:glutathione S-transferase
MGKLKMLLYDSIGPNPKVVRMFIAERGITCVPTQTVDLMAGENRKPAYMAKNPTCGLPALELDDGGVLTEITVICEYLDEITIGGSSLIGTNAEQRGETRMWTRRIDLGIAEPLTAGFRYAEGLKMFSGRMRCIPQAADDLKAIAKEKLAWLDGQIAGRQFMCGDRLTLADIMLFAFVQFGNSVRQKLDPANANLTAWYDRMAARPSAAA